MVFISHAHHYIFVHIPKTGGTSITTTMKDWYKYLDKQREDPEPEIHHMNMDKIVETVYPIQKIGRAVDMCGEQYCTRGPRDYIKFCFVRNPWDRFLSGYTEFVNNRTAYGEPEAVELAHTFPTFESFCKGFATSKFRDNVHFRPQSTFINADINFIGRYENLQEDFIRICEHMVLPVKDGHMQADWVYSNAEYVLKRWDRKSNHVPYTEAYTPETRDIVGEIFKEDIEIFDYSFYPET
jgi:hypothetical protein